jgi:hypothetical protein
MPRISLLHGDLYTIGNITEDYVVMDDLVNFFTLLSITDFVGYI